MDELKYAGILRLLLTIGFAAMGGCKVVAEDSSPTDAVEHPFIVLATGQNSPGGSSDTSKKLLAIHSQAELATVYSELTADTPPAIDFSTEAVLAVVSDSLPSGGYRLTVSAVQDYAQYTLVDVVLTAPGQGCVVTAALTTPFELVKIAKPTAPLLFRETFASQDCT